MASLDEDRIRDLIGDFRKDHAELLRKVEGLEQVLTRVAEARGEASAETGRALGETAAFFQDEFLTHSRDEDLVLFPLLQPYEGAGQPLPDLLSEHGALRQQIEAFVRALGDVALRGLRVAQLLHRHIEREESILARLAEQVRPAEENQGAIGGGG
jgi:hemerythrin-like domain-containing protein